MESLINDNREIHVYKQEDFKEGDEEDKKGKLKELLKKKEKLEGKIEEKKREVRKYEGF